MKGGAYMNIDEIIKSFKSCMKNFVLKAYMTKAFWFICELIYNTFF